MDRLTKEQRRKNMQAVKSKGSQIETMLAKALWAKGFRYRKNDKSVFGKPDFTFKKYRISIQTYSFSFWRRIRLKKIVAILIFEKRQKSAYKIEFGFAVS